MENWILHNFDLETAPKTKTIKKRWYEMVDKPTVSSQAILQSRLHHVENLQSDPHKRQ